MYSVFLYHFGLYLLTSFTTALTTPPQSQNLTLSLPTSLDTVLTADARCFNPSGRFRIPVDLKDCYVAIKNALEDTHIAEPQHFSGTHGMPLFRQHQTCLFVFDTVNPRMRRTFCCFEPSISLLSWCNRAWHRRGCH